MVEHTVMAHNPPERILSKEEIIAYLGEKDPDQVIQLYLEADRVREDFMGDEVHIRGIIEFSNYCERDCLYCGLRKSNNQLIRYRMTTEEIFLAARLARGLNFKTVVLQSGEDPSYSVEEICSLVRRIKANLNMAITLCIGERSFEDYERFRKAGADRYLLKFETSNPSLFRRLKPDTSYEQRLRCLDWLKQLGYQVGSGNMVGLPGQTLENLAEDILAFERLDLDMIGIGPFIPHPNTPLRDARKEELDTVLKVVALTRLVTRNTHIPATTAVGTLYPGGRQKALQCGANVIMPNATPKAYRQLYQIYPNKICLDESPQNCRHCIEGMVTSLGRRIGNHFGHTMKTIRPLWKEENNANNCPAS